MSEKGPNMDWIQVLWLLIIVAAQDRVGLPGCKHASPAHVELLHMSNSFPLLSPRLERTKKQREMGTQR